MEHYAIGTYVNSRGTIDYEIYQTGFEIEVLGPITLMYLRCLAKARIKLFMPQRNFGRHIVITICQSRFVSGAYLLYSLSYEFQVWCVDAS